jgi:tRNA pseudouridine13 synthase
MRKINVIKKTPPKLEQNLGLGTYVSKNDGISGKIKVIPEDFLVEEITPEGEVLELNKEEKTEIANIQEAKEYIHFTLKKYNWDTIRAIKEISKRLRVSRKRFGFAGTKDKRAITLQRVSLWNKKIEDLMKVKIKDIEIKNPTYEKERINLGNLWGNRFTITIRDISSGSKKEIKKGIDSTLKELNSKIPAFFGIQRFGIQRPITHLVGKEILKRNFKKALMLYLSKDFSDENEEAREARKFLSKTENFREALKKFPKHLGYENAMLNHLAQVPTDYIGALRRLPKKLRWLFIHAYQAYIFNKALSTYIREGKTRVEKLPLVGYETKELDEVTQKILKEEGISPEDFKIKEMPEMSSKGESRKTFFEIKDFKIISIEDDDLHEKKKKAIIQFSLPKGSYATVLLREFIKERYW